MSKNKWYLHVLDQCKERNLFVFFSTDIIMIHVLLEYFVHVKYPTSLLYRSPQCPVCMEVVQHC